MDVCGIGMGSIACGGDGAVGGCRRVDANVLKAGDGGGDFREFVPDKFAFLSAPMARIIDGP